MDKLIKHLEYLGACEPALDFVRSCKTTDEVLAGASFEWMDWLVEAVGGPLWEQYEEANAPLWEQYEKARATLLRSLLSAWYKETFQ